MNVKDSGAVSAAEKTVLDTVEIERREQVDDLILLGKEQLFYSLDKMQELGEKAYELASQPNAGELRYERGIAGAIAILASRLVSLESFKEALEQATAGLGFLDVDEPDIYRGDLLSIIGDARFFMGETTEGLNLKNRARQLFSELGCPKDEGRVISGLSLMHFSLGHMETALELAEQAMEIYRGLSEPVLLMQMLNNIAWMYLQYEQIPPALEYSRESLRLCELHGCTNFEPSILDTLVAVYMALDELDLAEKYALQSVRISRATGDVDGEVTAEVRLSMVYEACGRLPEAVIHANIALDVKNSTENKIEVSDIHHMLAKLHEKLGQYEDSLKHMKELYKLEQEKAKQQADSRVTELRVQHRIETAKKDAQIYRLRAIALEGEVEKRRLDQIRLESENSLDPATGLFNRRHLQVLNNKLHDAHAAHLPTSLLMLDIDHFKNVNDTYGHLAGDKVIVMIAQQLRSHIREEDVALRFGGEEFIAFLPNTDIPTAAEFAENLRNSISQESVVFGDKVIEVTISIGVAISGDARSEELRSLIDRADHELYRAKELGRNRVEINESRTNI